MTRICCATWFCCWLAICFGATASASGDELGTVYLKNAGKGVAHVCIDHHYQGYVPAGRTMYTVRDGFVTDDSGRQPDGSLVVHESHGGWPDRGDVPIFVWFLDEHGSLAGSWAGTLPGDQKDVLVSLGDETLPNEEEVENAIQIRKGNADCHNMEQRVREAADPYSNTYANRKMSIKLSRDGDNVSAEIVKSTATYTSTGKLTDRGVNLAFVVDGLQVTLLIKAGDGQCSCDDTTKVVSLTQVGGLMAVSGRIGRKPGSGDVQVTVRWTGGPDVDLHVIDPNGEEIYYQHKKSASGGELDVDDTTGTGPENIFWPPHAAPLGQYVVRVVLFKGESAAWRVRVLLDGRTKTFSGVLEGEGTEQTVTVFKRAERPADDAAKQPQ